MPRISKSELSSTKEMTQNARLEILHKFGKFETEVKEFEGTHKLKGKSWDSAKQHFGEYLPISDGIFNALADFGERFEQYLAAFESEVGSPKNKLDTADLEDLNDRLKTVKASKAQVLELMKSKITQSYVASGYSGSVGQSFDNAMEDINKDIQVLEDYRRFESSHASDFSAVSETWDNIDTYLDRLKKDGGYDASSHTYQSVDFSQEKFYKELSSYNASQKDHYEVQRIAVKTDHGYTYEYRLYKNGLYDPEATDKFNQLQKKAEMDQAKDFFKEVVGINDYIRMVDGIDPLTGKKITHNEQAVSSLMFLLTVVSEATALKILKNMKNGKKILKDVELSQLKTPDKMVEGKVGKKVSGHKFGDVEKLENHFSKHGGEFKGLYSNADEYLQGANDVIRNGEKVQYYYPLKNGTTELRTGYVKFMGNSSKGKAKFEFVGTNLSGDITTYHVKRGEDVYKLLNGNKRINVINPIE
ncbi:T7SS effector LXG polymorphic toxin [Listeria aquatica]|uniref:T7SS effector LXG polymorphic toxin n=1 Tax=Listeria aquatica TaxID=1494960 RepID=UPI003F70BE3E